MRGAENRAGTRAGNAKKDTLPQAVERGGAGKWVVGLDFLRCCQPYNELYILLPRGQSMPIGGSQVLLKCSFRRQSSSYLSSILHTACGPMVSQLTSSILEVCL